MEIISQAGNDNKFRRAWISKSNEDALNLAEKLIWQKYSDAPQPGTIDDVWHPDHPLNSNDAPIFDDRNFQPNKVNSSAYRRDLLKSCPSYELMTPEEFVRGKKK